MKGNEAKSSHEARNVTLSKVRNSLLDAERQKKRKRKRQRSGDQSYLHIHYNLFFFFNTD